MDFKLKSRGHHDLLGELLRSVSRSFYLTLKVLPLSVREPISLAYLLARAADTISDTDAVDISQRLRLLTNFRQVMEKALPYAIFLDELNSFISQQYQYQERLLLERLEEAFLLLEQLNANDRSLVTLVVMTLSEGMLFDLEAFHPDHSKAVRALSNEETLERYTYLVAGCVGEFWSDICYAHEHHLKVWDLPEQRRLGVEFGKALQLTNILRDIADDLRIGRCYLPENQLIKLGISAESLLHSESVGVLRPVQHEWMTRALACYASAEHYIVNTPRRCIKLRLAMLWPVVIGLKTLQLVASNKDYLNPGQRIKVPRSEVYRLIFSSLPIVCSNSAIKCWLSNLRVAVSKSME